MIKQVVECDYCGKQRPVTYVDLFGMADIPKDWYTVARGAERIKHYCSKQCVVKGEESNE
ncbi:MAG: hypothetical protein GX664_04015 [Bacteroidales bacterium]|nr:hypothetical protein [Bacteroidales bacterium]